MSPRIYFFLLLGGSLKHLTICCCSGALCHILETHCGPISQNVSLDPKSQCWFISLLFKFMKGFQWIFTFVWVLAATVSSADLSPFCPDPARVINMPPVIYVPRKLPGIIRCPVDANPPVTSVKWEKDGYPLRVEKVSRPRSRSGWSSCISSFQIKEMYTFLPTDFDLGDTAGY